jgi:type I restriction enzyme, S subunit
LEGLEISEIKKSLLNKVLRIEAEFFQKKYLCIEAQLIKKLSAPLESLVSKVSDGTHFTPTYVDEGVPFLSALNILDSKIDIEAGHQFITHKEHLSLYRRCDPKLGDILLRKVGVGPRWAAVVPAGLPEFSVFVSVALIRPRTELISPEVFTVFINGEYGQSQFLRVQKGASQPDLHLEDIREVLVPIFGGDFQEEITRMYKKLASLIEQSKTSYAQAEQALLEAVGLADFKPSTQNTNIKTFAQIGASSRLDAEYYQTKYEVFEATVKSNKNGYTMIKNEYDQFNTVSRKPKTAYHYIEISDVNVSDGTNSPILIETIELPANAKFEVIKGDLIISKVRPNRGAVTVIEADFDNLIVSGAFTVLREKPSSVFTKEVLKVLLRTPIYREWMLQFNVGTQYPVIRDEDILNLPIPKIDLYTQNHISELVQKSFKLKAESERLLSVAKRAVEMAIEQNEAAAMHFIENSTNQAFETHQFFEKNQ